MATTKSNCRKRERQRRRHEQRPQRQQYSPLSRGLLVLAPTPLGIMREVLAEQIRENEKVLTPEERFQIVLEKKRKKKI
jgi:hypothetical protein